MPLSATITVDFQAALTRALDLVTGASPLAYRKSLPFTNGAGANQAQYLFHDRRTLTASGSEDLDMAGSLVDIYGNTLTFATIKAMLFYIPSTAGGDLTVTAKATNGFATWVGAAGDAVKIKPGGLLLLLAPGADGYAVTAGTGDLITVTNGDGAASVDYDVILMGD